jgi:hypothetical protein
MTSLLIQTRSLYAGIWDENSPINQLGYLENQLKNGKIKATQNGEEALFGLFVLNDQLIEQARQENLISWTLMFDSVFLAKIDEVSTSNLVKPLVELNLGEPHIIGSLKCPSGKLILNCLGMLGVKQSPTFIVEPGTYQVFIERNEVAEFDHALIDSVDDYPSGEGPDWILKIQRTNDNF